MTPRDVRTYLGDILAAAAVIRRFTEHKSFVDYASDQMLRKAVERDLITIGEALGKATALDPTVRARIREARSIIGLRNRLTHVYADTDDELVWGAVTVGLPQLVADVERMLTELEM